MAVATTTLAIAAIAATALAAGVSAYGASQQADAQAKAAQYQAAVAQNNQVIANQNAAAAQQQATAATQAGEQAAQTRQLQAAAQVSKIRAGAGAEGIDPNTGSAVALQSDAEKLGTLDALTIRNNAARTAYGYNVQAVGDIATGNNFSSQSTLDQMTAANANSAGFINASSSLIGGASSVSDKWQKYQSTGSTALAS